MKTVLYTLDYPPQYGGVANYYSALVNNWPEQEIKVLQPKNCSFKGFNFLYYFFFLFFKSFGVNQIIVGQIFPLGLPAFLIGKKYTVVLHGLDLSIAQKRRPNLTKLILKKAAKVVAANSYTASLAEKLSGRKVAVVNPSFFPGQIDEGIKNKYKEKLELAGKIVFLSLGRLVERKGFDFVIEAWEKVKKEVPTAVYIIAGDGPEGISLKNLSLGKKDIIFLGAINEAEKWSLLSLCDIFIMPSRDISGDYEGFGIVYLEAGSLCKPVIAGASGGVADAVIDGQTGVLIDPKSITAISQAMIDLALDKKRREDLGEQGRERAKSFSPQNLAQEFYNIIK